MCTCRVMICIITLWAHAEWWCVSLHYVHMENDSVYHYIVCTCRVMMCIIILCAHGEWLYVSLCYVHMQSVDVYHYIMCTRRVMMCIITLCAHREWGCVSLHYVHMQRDGVCHYIPSRLKWTHISLPPMLIGQTFYMKCMRSEHAAQKYARKLHKIWKQLTF